MNKDHISTVAGSGFGGALLATVRWEAVPQGECVKIALALLFMLVGFLMYRQKANKDGKGDDGSATD